MLQYFASLHEQKFQDSRWNPNHWAQDWTENTARSNNSELIPLQCNVGKEWRSEWLKAWNGVGRGNAKLGNEAETLPWKGGKEREEYSSDPPSCINHSSQQDSNWLPRAKIFSHWLLNCLIRFEWLIIYCFPCCIFLLGNPHFLMLSPKNTEHGQLQKRKEKKSMG